MRSVCLCSIINCEKLKFARELRQLYRTEQKQLYQLYRVLNTHFTINYFASIFALSTPNEHSVFIHQTGSALAVSLDPPVCSRLELQVPSVRFSQGSSFRVVFKILLSEG